MPLYDYRCERCGEEWEKLKEIAEHETDPCPKCGQKGTQLLKMPRVQTFKPFLHSWLPKETLITSKSQLREECKKQGVVSRYLL